MQHNLLNSSRIRAVRVLSVFVVSVAVFAAISACASDPEPVVEDFPSLLLGVWAEIGGPDGTLTFTGTAASGIGRLSADGVQAETFTFQWVAPAIIRTDINDDVEFSVLFENGGDTLVLATVAAASTDEVIRYRRVE